VRILHPPNPLTTPPVNARLGWAAAVAGAVFHAPLMAAEPVLAGTPAPDTPCEWSRPVNGLSARICLSRIAVYNGSPLIQATVSFWNGTYEPRMSIAWRVGAIDFSIVDSHGAPVTAGINVDGMQGGSIMSGRDPPLILPPHGEISIPIPGGGGVARDKAAVLQLGTFPDIYAFEPTDRPLFLHAVFELHKQAPAERGDWSGRIVFPDVRIPLGLTSANPATFAATLAEADALIATGDPEKTIAAVDRLSLLNDLRVVPLYMKAFALSDYSVKFRVIDNLGALLRHFPKANLDAVMAGLTQASRIGPADAGRATNEKVAAEVASVLRQSVVQVLAGSSNPDARKLLMTMQSDPDEKVRDLAGRYLKEH